MNTLITYQYRDAANYKVFDTVVIGGLLSISDIEEYLYEEEFFIPSEIGLKDLQPESLSHDDYIWHEMLEISHTNEKPTVDITAEKVMFNFKRASLEGRNILEVSKRLGVFI